MPPATAPAVSDRPTAGHDRRAAVLVPLAVAVAVTAVVLGAVVALVVVWWAGLLTTVVVAAGLCGAGAARVAGAEARAVSLVGPSRPLGATAVEARLLNLLDGLGAVTGVPPPECHMVDDTAPNALALGRDARHGHLVVTTGLLGRLSRVELEGVVARALVQLRDGATAGPTVALAIDRGGRLLPRAMGRDDAAAADLTAVAVTRYPPGLASALESLAGCGDVVPTAAAAALAPMWLVTAGDRAALLVRVEALDEL